MAIDAMRRPIASRRSAAISWLASCLPIVRRPARRFVM
jgi:hypothetical protein